MSELKYNFPALLAAADNCSSSVKNMTAELDGLQRGLQPLIASWEGDAQASYLARQAQWTSASNDLKTLLTGIEKALRESAAKMQAREAANKAKFEV